ncbi:hypothetical protein AB6A40_005797 [Gnathostoma spinigerum]|uniref:Sodium/potassium-transporting ATPase subunit beta-1-interacting protein n=1 Tax=Gnathostoma spinigerum TaxID=75299 RepID=A0ABD6EGG8_9BILA
MCRCSLRVFTLFILSIWLFLSVSRELFDLIGRLWIPVVFDLLQILACISGLFAFSQYRLNLLLSLSIWCIVCFLYNLLLFAWYFGLLGDHNLPILSAGLPFSHSFFLKYTPTCSAYFDLNDQRWVQSECPIAYTYIEMIQALAHMILCVLITVLATIIFRRNKYRHKKYAKARTAKEPRITIEFADKNKEGPKLAFFPASSAEGNYSYGNGYANSSFDTCAEGYSAHNPFSSSALDYARRLAHRTAVLNSQLKQPARDNYSVQTTLKCGSYTVGSNCRNTQLDEESIEPDDNWDDEMPRSSVSETFSHSSHHVNRILSDHLLYERECPLTQSVSLHRLGSQSPTSLVSFDPKSKIVLRYQQHFDDGQAGRRESLSNKGYRPSETSLKGETEFCRMNAYSSGSYGHLTSTTSDVWDQKPFKKSLNSGGTEVYTYVSSSDEVEVSSDVNNRYDAENLTAEHRSESVFVDSRNMLSSMSHRVKTNEKNGNVSAVIDSRSLLV